jgi:hypothetical protein
MCAGSRGRIMDVNGELLGRAQSTEFDDNTIAIISSKMWVTYNDFKVKGTDEVDLQCLLFDFEHSKIVVSSVSSRFLVCLYGKSAIEAGLLKAKLTELQKLLKEKFASINM